YHSLATYWLSTFLPEIIRGYFVPITYLFEVFSVMLSTGFIGLVLISRAINRLCPFLAFWLGVYQVLS
ncbi:hypothetical protein, partial [Planktothrix tepida]|uniref:hypothetical protein n=1 Tax=Planktothrix tepida TaxID=1678309 RepID=UPI001C96FE63